MKQRKLGAWSLIVILALAAGCTEPETAVPPAAKNIDLLIKPEDRLVHAIEKGDLSAVEQALTTGSDPNSPGSDELPPLEVAARHGFVDAGRALLAHQADIDRVPIVKTREEDGKMIQRRGNSALHTAVATGQVEFVKFLIDNKADINVRNGRDTTPLDIAKNSAEVLKSIQTEASSPERIASITERLSKTNALITLLEEHGGKTTQDFEAKKLEEINGGGILGRLPAELRGKSGDSNASKNPFDRPGNSTKQSENKTPKPDLSLPDPALKP
ncbi:MAG: ankyrin repeat domain-containing protein [Planctomycetes bacterium]|nr:ankyrin repeat domain-containing protein [Planctomycetota bacterium]